MLFIGRNLIKTSSRILRRVKYVMLDYYYSMKCIHIFVIAIVVTLLAKGNAIKSNKTDVLWPLPSSYSFETEG